MKPNSLGISENLGIKIIMKWDIITDLPYKLSQRFDFMSMSFSWGKANMGRPGHEP